MTSSKESKIMRFAPLSLTLLSAAALMTACANVERSRDTANPSVAGATLAQQVCINCHGVTGNAISPNFPNLAGQTEEYVASQLNGFKNQNRRDPAGFEYMWGLSRNLTDEQVKQLAQYYSAQKPAQQPLESTPEKVAAGQLIYQSGVPDKGVTACFACHGAQGQGNGTMPRLAGQHVDYVSKQLLVFQRTDLRPEGSVMKTIAHGLSEEDIENVAAFVQSLQP